MKALLWIAIGYLLLVAAVFLLQQRLLYLPQRASVEQLAHGPLRAWPTAADFRGLLAEPAGAARGTVIVFHGNAGHAGHRAFYAQALLPLGWRVILAEYPGYGPRDGALGEASLVADARATLALAQRQFGSPLVVLGESLGAGVAAAAVEADTEGVAGLLLITPWDRLAHVAAHHYRWLPVEWLLRDGYDSAPHLAGFQRPIAIVVTEHDRVVPTRFGHALHEALRGPKRLLVIEDSGHNDWPDRVDAAWWREAIGFAAGERPR
ncbi:alpha/beta hydrolase [Caldimonas sp. KR1-144]|uniref:alpha/beta hydrolase n=1 Tax=Caldimonas sp. KR1-144 TaxID=3400911 RepID=UPI003BFB601A